MYKRQAIGFKKIEKEAPGLTEEYRLASLNDSKMIDILLSGSQWCTEMLQRSFWYCGKVLEVGSPRNDIFFLDNDELKLCIRTVSYTHLDVYKRQILDIAFF